MVVKCFNKYYNYFFNKKNLIKNFQIVIQKYSILVINVHYFYLEKVKKY